MTNTPLISFLIPLYNCAGTLRRCIDSITSQSDNFSHEIVVVNDGSTDNFEPTVRELISEGAKIRIYNQNNLGIAYTRQRLLDLATGKYIMFVDPDDFLLDNTVGSLLSQLEAENADAICFPFIYDDNVDRLTTPTSIEISTLCFSGKEFMTQLDYRWTVALWHFIILRSSINQIFVPEIDIAEDLIFLLKQLPRLNKILSTNLLTYVYCFNTNSITQTRNRTRVVKRSKSFANAAIMLSDICRNGNLNLPDSIKPILQKKANYFSYLSISQAIMGGVI